MTSREFAAWPAPQAAQDTAAALERANQALERIAARHADNGFGACTTCYSHWNVPLRWPCPDYRDATGATP